MSGPKRRKLGRMAAELPPLGLGCSPLGELFVRIDEATAEAALQTAWEGGIRYLDTAPEYGAGLSEHRVGRFLRSKPRGDYILTTKVGRLLTAPRDPARIRRESWLGGLDFEASFDYGHDAVLRSVEDSYQRLGLNRIDALLIHDLDLSTHGTQAKVDSHLRELRAGGFRALADLRSSGTIGAIGVGLNDPGMVLRLLEDFALDFCLLAMQYTLLEHRVLEAELPACRKRGVAVIAAGIFNSGILASGAVDGAYYNYAPAGPEIMDRVRRIEVVCRRHAVPLPAAAMQFPLAHPGVISVLVGADSPAQVAANLANFCHPIPSAFWAELKSAGLLAVEAPVPAEAA